MTELSSVIDKYGVYIYKNPLIYFRVETFTNWRHREATVAKDPMGNAYICRLDEEIFSDFPEFEPDILSEEKLKSEFIAEGWMDLFIAIFNAARTHSWCIVKLYDEEPFWRVFTWRELKEMRYNSKDVPIGATLEWTTDLVGSEKYKTHKEVVWFNRNTENTLENDALFIPFGIPRGKHLGQYDLEAIWDLIVYIRYQMLDIVNNSAKTSGFWHIVYGNAIKDSQKTDLINSFDYTGIGQAIGAKENVVQDIKFHYPEHPEFTVEAMNESLNLLSGASRLPLSFFRGEKEGGGVFQEGFSDEAKINKKKKYIFGQFKKYIIQLIRMRWGKEITDVNPAIEEELQKDVQMEQQAGAKFGSDHFNNGKKQEVKKLA